MKETFGPLDVGCYGAKTLRRRLSEREHLRQALTEIASLTVWDRNSSGHRAYEVFTKIQQIITEALGCNDAKR